MSNVFTLGADPEVFLKDAQGGLISAIDKIGGSKHDPLPLPIGDGFCVQEDNVAMEYNIPPSASRDEFVDNISKAMNFLLDKVKEQGLSFDTRSAAEFPIEQLMHFKALEFGCDPDFNAWNGGQVNPRPRATNMALRSCGGHVHVGYKFKNREDMLSFIKRCDFYLGVPSVLMDEGDERRQLYGKPGAFRSKAYGCEYRTLSNFWIFKPELTQWVYEGVQTALESTFDPESERESILECLNNNNKLMAADLVGRYAINII